MPVEAATLDDRCLTLTALMQIDAADLGDGDSPLMQ